MSHRSSEELLRIIVLSLFSTAAIVFRESENEF